MPPDDEKISPKNPKTVCSIEDELKLQPLEASTINELAWKNPSGQVPLPLPKQDREVMEKQIERNSSRFRISILEMILGTTFVCCVLALTKWVSLPVLTLCLGCCAVLIILGLFDSILGKSTGVRITWLLVVAYLISAAVSLIQY